MNLEVNYTFFLLFRALVPARRKYNLAINELMILNACYIYQKHIGTAFTQYAMRHFFTYYDYLKIKYYIGTLQEKKMIYESDFAKRQLYKMTELGIEVIEKLNGDYQESLVKFCQTYNIQL
jgi:hypothetical protein